MPSRKETKNSHMYHDRRQQVVAAAHQPDIGNKGGLHNDGRQTYKQIQTKNHGISEKSGAGGGAMTRTSSIVSKLTKGVTDTS